MAYGDYLDAATLLDTCDAALGDTPGKNAGCRFIGQSEGASTATANRPHLALAENMDNLKLPLDSMLAVTEVGYLSSFSGSSIDVDPTVAAAGDINLSPAGYLYFGNGVYSGLPLQEALDTLFQLVDSDYNEVMVDGAEVKINAISVGPAVGTGFYNTAMVTLSLNKTLPSGDYRLKFARDATLATLPDDALITADIRGVHEGAGESAKPTWSVCAPAGGVGDYVGTTAVQEALADNKKRIYVKAGSYTVSSFSLANITDNETTIRGEGRGQVTITCTSGGFTVNAENVTIEGVTLATTDADQELSWTNDGGRLKDFDLLNMRLEIETADLNFVAENGIMGGYERALQLGPGLSAGSGFSTFREIEFRPGASATAQPVIDVRKATNTRFEGCRCVMTSGAQDVLEFGGVATGDMVQLGFFNCWFESYSGQVVSGGSNSEFVRFEQCTFKTHSGQLAYVAGPDWLSVIDCVFECTNSWTGVQAIVYLSSGTELGRRGTLRNCRFNLTGVAAAAGQDIALFGMDGGNIEIVYSSAYDGTTPLLEISLCDLTGVRVSVPSITNPNSTFMVEVGTTNAPARVKDLVIDGFVGNITSQAALTILGDEEEGTSIVDGLQIGTNSTTNTNSQAIIRLGSHSVLRRFLWDRQAVDSNVQPLVGLLTGNLKDITIEDCYIDVYDQAAAWSVSGGPVRLVEASSVSRLKILRNFIRSYGASGATTCKYAVRVDASISMLLQGNVIQHGDLETSIADPEIPISNPVFLDSALRPRIVDNEVLGSIPSTPNDAEKKMIYSNAAASGGGLTGGAIIHQNIFRSASGNGTPTIGNDTTENDAAFLNATANNQFLTA